MSERLYSIPAIAERLDVSQKTVRRLIESRRIAVVKIGRLVRIPESAVTNLVARSTQHALEVEDRGGHLAVVAVGDDGK